MSVIFHIKYQVRIRKDLQQNFYENKRGERNFYIIIVLVTQTHLEKKVTEVGKK